MNDRIAPSALLSANSMIDFDTLPAVTFEDRPAPAPLLQSANAMALRPFSLMRSKLQQKAKEQNLSLIGITSPTPSAGKSSLSIAIAASLAKVVDRPIVLLDLDMRRASIAEYLGLDVGVGLSDFLANPHLRLEQAGVRIPDANIILFPSNETRTGTAELLAGARFKELTDALRAHPLAPLCIVDLPPAFANDDTMIAMERLDGYIMVVESGKTTKRHVLDVLKMLAPAKCYGTILNRYEGTIGDSYSYGSAAYSKYYD